MLRRRSGAEQGLRATLIGIAAAEVIADPAHELPLAQSRPAKSREPDQPATRA